MNLLDATVQAFCLKEVLMRGMVKAFGLRPRKCKGMLFFLKPRAACIPLIEFYGAEGIITLNLR